VPREGAKANQSFVKSNLERPQYQGNKWTAWLPELKTDDDPIFPWKRQSPEQFALRARAGFGAPHQRLSPALAPVNGNSDLRVPSNDWPSRRLRERTCGVMRSRSQMASPWGPPPRRVTSRCDLSRHVSKWALKGCSKRQVPLPLGSYLPAIAVPKPMPFPRSRNLLAPPGRPHW
jgi:hypothetical protein